MRDWLMIVGWACAVASLVLGLVNLLGGRR